MLLLCIETDKHYLELDSLRFIDPEIHWLEQDYLLCIDTDNHSALEKPFETGSYTAEARNCYGLRLQFKLNHETVIS